MARDDVVVGCILKLCDAPRIFFVVNLFAVGVSATFDHAPPANLFTTSLSGLGASLDDEYYQPITVSKRLLAPLGDKGDRGASIVLSE
jgi:hypothetical protein